MTRLRRIHVAGAIGTLVLGLFVVTPVGALVYVERHATSPVAADGAALPMTAPTTRDHVTETFVAGVTVEQQDGFAITASRSGVLTSLSLTSGSTVGAGDLIASVDDRPIFAFTGSAPLHRTLELGRSGPDVRRLQAFLTGLGLFSGEADGRFGPTTANAVGAWNTTHGSTGRQFDQSSVTWIGPEPIVVAELAAAVGQRVSPDTVLAHGPRTTLAVLVDAQGVAPGDYELTVGPISVQYTAPGGRIDSPPARDDLASVIDQDGAAGILTSRSATEVLVVPASAVVTDLDGSTCVFPDAHGRAIEVTAVGSRAGVVHLPGDTQIREVLVNPADVRSPLSCD